MNKMVYDEALLVVLKKKPSLLRTVSMLFMSNKMQSMIPTKLDTKYLKKSLKN